MDRRLRLGLAVVHTPYVVYEWAESVMKVFASGHQVYFLTAQSGALICRARNVLMDRFLKETDADYLLWTDSDNVFKPEDVEKLVDDDKPIVGGLYHGIDREGLFNVASLKNPKGKGFVRWKGEPDTGLHEVGGIGFGCTLVKREVIEGLNEVEPISNLWPCYEGYLDGDKEVPCGEDIIFCSEARKLGFKTYLDSDIRIGHVKPVLI